MDAKKRSGLAQHLLTIALVPVIIAALGWLSLRYKTELDWTAGNRNTLTAASVKLLDSMPEPIHFTAFVYSDGELQRSIKADIERYQREKANIDIEFVDPSKEPQRVQEAGVSAVGEVVVEYQVRKETLRALTEPAITTALQRLAFAGDRWVLFLEGHGERALEGEDPTAISQFAQSLRDKGLKLRGLNLAADPSIPDNASVLVIASPQRKLLDGEVKLIADWVAQGGNLVWLADPDSPAHLDALEAALGIHWQDGVAVFPDYQLTSGHPGILVTGGYPPNAVTRDFTDITIFPLLRSLSWDTKSGWTAQPLVQTPASAWLETGKIEGALAFEPEQGDLEGPLTVALTLTRPLPAATQPEGEAPAAPQQQRVVLVGDADFLSNSYVGEIGNGLLGRNIVQWAAARDSQLNIDVPKAPDTSLYLPGWALFIIIGGFVLVLPLGLIGFGVARWAVRRRR